MNSLSTNKENNSRPVNTTLIHKKVNPLTIAMASPEIAPFAKTGGLADVLGSLPLALEKAGLNVYLIMPGYGCILRNNNYIITDTGFNLSVHISNRTMQAQLLKTKIGRNIPVYLIRYDHYFDRENLYGDADGDYSDNTERFIFFSRAILEVLKLYPPDILHTHDWQSDPQLSSVKTICTVHNLGYQGHADTFNWHLLNMDWSYFNTRQLEFYGKINMLKGGLIFADTITTVSPTYAEEIKNPENGFGMDGVFRERANKLYGILNGADYNLWNPENDKFIVKNFSSKELAGKKDCKTDIQKIFNLPRETDVPIIGMISRLTEQKGFGLVEQAFNDLISRDIQFVMIGTGDRYHEDYWTKAAKRYRGKAGIKIDFNEELKIDFNEELSHKIIAGADIFLMPSLYEPSGLTQLYSMHYGTIPVARSTGGLKDSVKEFNPDTGEGNGFLFGPYKEENLLTAVDKSLQLYFQKEAWTRLIKNAMSCDFSWENSAKAYIEVYNKLTLN
ncbi:MAG: glycogen/starch synthase [Chloroflexi bacterium]|nr:glycogen/starch synthase [Chloroflexota bacterium]